MSIFTVASEQVQFTTAAVDPADTFIGGIRFAPDGKVRASTDAAVVFNGGIPQTGSGQVCVVDATSGLPAGTVFVNAIPVSADNKVCCSTGVATAYNNGTPYAANGAICATGLASFPLDGITTPNFAYALFPLTAAFVGQPVVRVRDTTNNAETNVLGSADGNITDANEVSAGGTLGAWRSAGGGLAVKILYQQGAVSGVNLEQATATSQPLIMSAGFYIAMGTGGKTTMRSIGQAGANASLESTGGFVVTQAQASVDAQSSTFMTVQRASPAASSANQIFLWYGSQLSLYLAFSGTDYYLDMPQPDARITGTWANKDVAAVVTAWRSSANMALLRDGTTIGSRSNASTSVNAGPGNLLFFPTTSPDFFASCFISWPSKIADASISTVSARLKNNLDGASALPLDGLSPSFAVGTMRLRTAYTGPWGRVRDKGNNSETDLGFDSTGWFSDSSPCSNGIGTPPGGMGNTTPYSTWRGASTDYQLMRWLYDQSGNAANMGQGIVAAQTAIRAVGLPFYTMGSSGRRTWSSNDQGGFGNMSMDATVIPSNTGTAATFVAVLDPVSQGNYWSWLFNTTNSGLRGPNNTSPFDFMEAQFNGQLAGGTVTPVQGTGPKLVVARRNGANGVFRVNGSVVGTSTTLTGNLGTTAIGMQNLGMFANAPGYIRYILFAWFPYALSDAEISTLESRINTLGVL
jgi:hypothetical protein